MNEKELKISIVVFVEKGREDSPLHKREAKLPLTTIRTASGHILPIDTVRVLLTLSKCGEKRARIEPNLKT